MMPGIASSKTHPVFAYIAKSPADAAARPLAHFRGDKIVSGIWIEKRDNPTGKYSEGGQLLGSEREGWVYLDSTPPEKSRIPLMFKLEPGTHKSELTDRIEAKRQNFRNEFEYAATYDVQLDLLRKYAATEKNLELASAGLPPDRKFTVQQRALDGFRHKTGEHILQAQRGYTCMLSPNQKLARVKRIPQRFKALAEGAKSTYRNPLKTGSSGTRSFWFNVPAAILVSIFVSGVTLAYLHNREKHAPSPTTEQFVTN